MEVINNGSSKRAYNLCVLAMACIVFYYVHDSYEVIKDKKGPFFGAMYADA